MVSCSHASHSFICMCCCIYMLSLCMRWWIDVQMVSEMPLVLSNNSITIKTRHVQTCKLLEVALTKTQMPYYDQEKGDCVSYSSFAWCITVIWSFWWRYSMHSLWPLDLVMSGDCMEFVDWRFASPWSHGMWLLWFCWLKTLVGHLIL